MHGGRFTIRILTMQFIDFSTVCVTIHLHNDPFKLTTIVKQYITIIN